MPKETYYIKDKYDGQEYCISGEKHFYLINADEIVKRKISEALTEQRAKIEKEIINMLDNKIKKL